MGLACCINSWVCFFQVDEHLVVIWSTAEKFKLTKALVQSSNDYMRAWKETKHNLYLHECLHRKASNQIYILCKTEASWPCLNCFASKAYCTECCQTSHCRDPFHQIEQWPSTFYELSWLWKVGLVIQLGHSGDRCPDKAMALMLSLILMRRDGMTGKTFPALQPTQSHWIEFTMVVQLWPLYILQECITCILFSVDVLGQQPRTCSYSKLDCTHPPTSLAGQYLFFNSWMTSFYKMLNATLERNCLPGNEGIY